MTNAIEPSSFFDKDYYENGIASGKSCYENYRWIPELTYPLAHSICDNLALTKGAKLLDYGCAHGFTVKALRDFGIDAYGCDVSAFAISNSLKDVDDYVKVIDLGLSELIDASGWGEFDWVMAKDVFEHIPENELEKIIKDCSAVSKNIFIVVPLGENGKYRIAAYEDDPSHVIRENEEWWKNILEENGFHVTTACNDMLGIKDRWFSTHAKGNGFFIGRAK
jgi:predicted TPR repeat methyltransferase